MSCTGPKRVEVLRDVVTIRGALRLRLLNAFDPLNGSAEVFLRRLCRDDPHRDGNRLLPLPCTLRAVGGMDDGGWFGGHRQHLVRVD